MIRRLLFASAFISIALGSSGCGKISGPSLLKSITDPDYNGIKHYFGWGEYLTGFMGNETKYDVQHTHSLFTSGLGGDYQGRKLTGHEFNQEDIHREWNTVRDTFKSDDMYVQYSSGHGSDDGLAVGVSYDEMRDYALSLNARETVIFTMACYSGNLVDSFKAKKNEWENHRAEGRTLFVMASSESDDTSSTGPGRDPDEPNGPNGSAGSAFGHALWKALIGYADRKGPGMTGNADGKISLEEIINFTVKKTQQVGGHTPVHTGSYDPALVIAKVPSPAQLEALLGATDEGRRELAELRADGFID